MGTTGAVFYFSPRLVSGLFTQPGVSTLDLSNLIPWLPPVNHPIGSVQGTKVMIDPAWWRFFRFVADVKLGGPNGATLPEVVSTVESGIADSTAVAATVEAVSQVVNNNALALKTTVEANIDFGIPGADQTVVIRYI